jgi:hypothetical protein
LRAEAHGSSVVRAALADPDDRAAAASREDVDRVEVALQRDFDVLDVANGHAELL